MEKIITFENLRRFAYCNYDICHKPIRGIVISFPWLDAAYIYEDDTPEGQSFAQEGILYLVPYQNPWAWMNKYTVALAEELLDVIFDTYQLPKDTPIVSTGISMGGLSALTYAAYAKRKPVACVANCPVCDLPYHFTERPDLPRTLYSAFIAYDGTLEDALRSASPLHLVDKLPISTKYFLFHCEADLAVNKEIHSDCFAGKMRRNHKIEYFIVPNRGHCDLTPDMQALYFECIRKSIVENCK